MFRGERYLAKVRVAMTSKDTENELRAMAYALGELTPEQKNAFDILCSTNPDLKILLKEMQIFIAPLQADRAASTPPEGLREALLAAIRSEKLKSS